jgi:hypothetical protein
MKARDEVARKSPQGSAQPRPTGSIIARALLASAAVIGVIAISLHVGSGGAIWPLHASGDAVSQANAELRAEQFATLAPLPLSLVPTSESAAALDGMQLAPSAKAALAESLTAPSSAARTAGGSGSVPSAAAASPEPLRLAWGGFP